MKYQEVFIINRTALNPDYGFSVKEVSNTLYIPVTEGGFKGQYRAIYGAGESRPVCNDDVPSNHIEEMWLMFMVNKMTKDKEYEVHATIDLDYVAELSALRRTR